MKTSKYLDIEKLSIDYKMLIPWYCYIQQDKANKKWKNYVSRMCLLGTVHKFECFHFLIQKTPRSRLSRLQILRQSACCPSCVRRH
jgi:hypothetical protein